jgi:L,D-peptidoglycan transpeptidase YkuD (ErfK/YbiS/YcfS/YnhG family)
MEFIVRPPNIFSWQNETYQCALGRSGITSEKSEGDGGTPIGRFPLRRVFFRHDRLTQIQHHTTP